MGLFNSIVSSVSSAVSSAASTLSNGLGKIISDAPFPKLPKLDLPTVIDKVIDFFRRGKYDSKNASVEETKNINRQLSQYAKVFHNEANRVEEELLEEANNYFDKVLRQLEDMQSYDDFMRELPLKKIKNEIRELRKELKGKMKNRISRAYSLDNAELLNILELDSDSDRIKEMKEFTNRVMKMAINEFLETVEDLSESQIELVQDLILSQINQLSLTMKREQLLLEEMTTAFQQGEEELEKLKNKITYTINLCDIAIDELKAA